MEQYLTGDYDTISLILSSVIGLVSLAIAILVWWKIFSKAGYSGALGCLIFIPIINLILLLYFAFAEWPIEKELRQHKGGYRY